MFAVADGTQVAYVKEATWGVIPSSPEWQVIRMTGESFNINRESRTSSEITAERDVMDSVQVSGGAGGGFNFELSYGTYDEILESLLHNEWDDDVLVNGVKQIPLSFEKKLSTSESSASYLRYSGMVANTMNLSISAGEIVSGSFDFLGKGGTVGAAIVAGADYTDATTEKVLNATSHIGSFSIGGLASPKLLSVDLDISNNLMSAPIVSSMDSGDIGHGQFSVSGSLEVYFDDSALYSAFLAETASSLTITLGTVAGKKYKISLPKIKLSEANVTAGSMNSYVMSSISFQAIYDADLECTMQIERAVS